MRGKDPCIAERNRQIVALFAAGVTGREIGAQYGITRQSVSLILGSSGLLESIKEKRREPRAREKFRVTFARAMKRALWTAGYRKCWACKYWSATVTSARLCRQCGTERHFQRYGKRPDLRGITQSERISRLHAEGKIHGRQKPRP